MAKKKSLKQRLKNYGQSVELLLPLLAMALVSIYLVVTCIKENSLLINGMGVIVGIFIALAGCTVGIVGFVLCSYFLVKFIYKIHKENKEDEED